MTTFRVKSYVGIFECKIFTGNDGVDGLQTTFQVGRSDVTSLSSGLRVGFPLRTIQYPWTVYRSGIIIWILNLICTCTPFVNKMWNYFGFVTRSWHCTAVTIIIVPKLNQKNLPVEIHKAFFPVASSTIHRFQGTNDYEHDLQKIWSGQKTSSQSILHAGRKPSGQFFPHNNFWPHSHCRSILFESHCTMCSS